jgi:long-chain acyl-CoA synthetase
MFRDIHRRFGWKFWAIVSGGATLDPPHESFWERLGIAVLQGYGLTESTSLISVNHPFERGRGSIGKVLPGRDFKLSDSGEILVRGENIATNYWQAGELRPVAGEDGWFRTGDLGELDAAGYLHFKGRQKNVIVTPEGMKVFPADLEAALNAHPGIKEAVVFGIDRGGNAETCAVLLASGSAADIDAAVRNANSQLAGYQRILHYVVWPEADFPRTPTHKPRLAALRNYATEVLSDNGLPRSSPSAGRDHSEIADLVRKVGGRQTTQAVIPREGIEVPTDQTLNLSSLERVELMCALEERYQVDLNERDFAEVETIRDLEQLIATATRSTSPRQPRIEEPAASPSTRASASDTSGAATVAQEVETAKSERALAPARTTFTYPRWAQRFPIPIIRTIAYHLITLPLTYLFSWPKIVGREHLRGLRGPVLVVANHITYVDQGFILAALPFRLRKLAIAMEGERLEAMRSQTQTFTTAPTFRATQAVSPDTMKGRLARAWESRRKMTLPLAYYLATALFNVFPLPKLSGFRKSFAFAGELADKGYSILVFPEGLRTVNGEISEFRSGMGLLAEGLHVPVVPMRIRGLWEVNQRGWRIVAPWGAISVHIGEPVSYPATTPPEDIARDLESRVRAL